MTKEPLIKRKEYSVWVRFNRIKATSLKEAEKKLKVELELEGVLNYTFEILKALTRDFYPKEK